jgi:hypothetical protein
MAGLADRSSIQRRSLAGAAKRTERRNAALRF